MRTTSGFRALLLGGALLMLAPDAFAGQGGAGNSIDSSPRRTESVVVFPFINTSGQTTDEWIGAGIAETVVGDLKKAGTLSVVSPETVRELLRARSMKLDSSDGSAIVLSRDLRAQWLVIGAYQRVGDQVRITARMIDVRTGEIARTARIDGRISEIFTLQDQIVAALSSDGRAGGAVQSAASGGTTPASPSPAPSAAPPAVARNPEPTAASRAASAPAAPAGGAPVSTPPASATPAQQIPPTPAGAAGGRAGGPRGASASTAGLLRAAAAAAGPPPVAPATVARTPEGAITIRAVRLTEPIRLDGRLDERIYDETPAISDFIQQEPREGEPATEKTDAWIFFDDENLYLSARCWDSHPERDVADEMRRDGGNIFQNENFTVIFDTFHDKRNGMFFETNSIGGLRDALITDETDQNTDWNGVWDARTGKFENGWTVEMVVPFKTLRYKGGAEQVWGVNIRRVVRWKNEFSFLMAPPASLGITAFNRVSFQATMVGLEIPKSSLNFEIKPYGISGTRTDVNARPPVNNQVTKDWGLDAKYGLSKSLTLDLTYNTDFAQVEDDTQQVNLTRFNLFFPERREFFLEGRGIFAFGGAGTSGASSSNTPILFFSRRIGLNTVGPDGRALAIPSVVPILGGARVTGKAGKFSIGFLNIQEEEDPISGVAPTNFTVVRIKRDVFRRSYIGGIYTRRQETDGSAVPAGETFGFDALYSASQALNVLGYYARTRTVGVPMKSGFAPDDASYLLRFDWNTDRYGTQGEQTGVGVAFNPQVGFLRRADFRRSFGQARFSPRPARTHMRAIRRFVYQGSGEYLTNNAGRKDFTETIGTFAIEMQNSDKLTVNYNREFEFIPRPFNIATGVVVPVGEYDYQSGFVSYALGTQHLFSGTVSYQQGTLYTGTRRTVTVSGGRLELSKHLAIEPTTSNNWVKLPWGNFRATAVANRTTLSINPRMFLSTLIQYSSASHTLSTNTRFRWEYGLGSELFVVYSDGRDTDIIAKNGFPQLTNRAFIVKMNKLFRL